MKTQGKCTYCLENQAGKTEHVFPKGLGGEDIFMDCVCAICNNKFSDIERELLQNSFIGFVRTAEGIEGYSKNKKYPASLKNHALFIFDEENKIVYEAFSYQGLKSGFKAQIIQINGKLYIEGPDEEDIKLLIDAFAKWAKNNLIMITNKGTNFKGVKFSFQKNEILYEEISINKAKHEIFNHLIDSNSRFKEFIEPRLFFGNDGQLLVRSKSHEDAYRFIIQLLELKNRPDVKLYGYPRVSTQNNATTINVSENFQMDKFKRAITKIMLNCLIHYYPKITYHPLLCSVKKFILGANENIQLNFTNAAINLIDNNGRKTHYVLFFQQENNLLIRMNLFGTFISTLQINDLKLFSTKGCDGILEIDYKKKKQIFSPYIQYIYKIVIDEKK